jgi:hypothetical protein
MLMCVGKTEGEGEMEVFKDGNAWSVIDLKAEIAVSGRTKKEALENYEKARAFRAVQLPKLRAKMFGEMDCKVAV